MSEQQRVTASDGISLAVYSDGPADPPAGTVLALHGYPDNARLWDRVTELLAGQHRVVRYDMRGAGASDRPADRAAYRLEQLASDARAVLDATEPDRPVHLLGHDWGSIQCWHFLAAPQLAGRIASFTSISGPALPYARPWLRDQLRAGRYGPALRQLAHSAYLPFFLLPVLPELGWRSGLLDRLLGAPPPHRRRADALAGLALYRANLRGRPAAAPRSVDVPVQVLAPAGDAFVTPDLQLEAPRPHVTRLTGRTVPGGHWLPLSNPELVADAVAAFVRQA